MEKVVKDALSDLKMTFQNVTGHECCTTSLLVACLLVFVGLYWWMSRSRGKLPPGPSGVPILGYLPFLSKEPHKDFHKLSKKYGNVFGLYMGRTYVVVLGDYAAVKEGLSLNATLGRPPKLFDFLPDHGGLSSLNGEAWVEQRRFAVRSMRDIGIGGTKWEELVQEEVDEVLQMLMESDSQPMNIEQVVLDSVNNSVTTMLLGKRYKMGDPAREVVNRGMKMVMKTAEQTALRAFFPGIMDFLAKLGIGEQKESHRELKIFNSLLRKEVEIIKKTHTDESPDTFVVGYLREIQNSKANNLKNAFNEMNLIGNTQALLIGGGDTTSASVNWLFVYMATFPEVQKKVHQEIDAVLGKEGRARWIDRTKLPYTVAVTMEAQRYFPIANISPARIAMEDTKIGGYDIPKDTHIIANFWAIHTSSKYFKNPEKFIPERFLSEDGKQVITKLDGYLPFSIGRRNCPGESVAKVTTFLYFTTIMQKFTVLPPVGKTAKLAGKPGIATHAVDQEFRFIPRE